jgi:hypothetical protein
VKDKEIPRKRRIQHVLRNWTVSIPRPKGAR